MHRSGPEDITENLAKLRDSIGKRNHKQNNEIKNIDLKNSAILIDSFASTIYASTAIFVTIQLFIMIIFTLI